MEINGAFDTQSCDRGKLVIDQLTLDDIDRCRASAKRFLKAEHVGAAVVVVLEELPHVIELILVSYLTIDLDAAPGKRPAEKRRGELVVESYAVPAGVFTLEKKILQRLGPEATAWLVLREGNVKETSAAYLQSGDPAGNDDNHRRCHQTAGAWPVLVDVSVRTCDAGVIRLSQLPPHDLGVDTREPDIHAIARRHEEMRKSRRVVAQKKCVLGCRTDPLVRRGQADGNRLRVYRNTGLSGIHAEIRIFAEALREIDCADVDAVIVCL